MQYKQQIVIFFSIMQDKSYKVDRVKIFSFTDLYALLVEKREKKMKKNLFKL